MARGGARENSGRKKIEDRVIAPCSIKFDSVEDREEFLSLLKSKRSELKLKNGKLLIHILKQ